MHTIFISSEKSKTSDLQRLLLNIWAKYTKKEVINVLFYQMLAYAIHGKI